MVIVGWCLLEAAQKSITAHINISALLTNHTTHDVDFKNILKAESEMLVDGHRNDTRVILEDMYVLFRALSVVCMLRTSVRACVRVEPSRPWKEETSGESGGDDHGS
jgi:hypothetical protein